MKLSIAMSLGLVLLATVMAISANAADLDLRPKTVEKWYNNLSHAKEKFTKLHFFLQDVVAGAHPTAVEIARSKVTATSPTFFGLMRAFDDPLTVAGSPNSKTMGYGQGTYTLTSQEDISILFTFTFSFTEGKYKGSTLSVQGRNPLEERFREMPVIGGSGVFRLARGSAIASTFWANATTQDGIVEFNVYVLHYE